MKDPDVANFLEKNPDFVPNMIFALEHNTGIGEIPKGKKKAVAPAIFTMTNVPTKKLNLSDYGIDLKALLAKYNLATIKLAPSLLLDGIDTIPVVAFHLTSGNDKKEVREKEIKLMQEVMQAILKKHEYLYAGGDGQINFVKISKDKKSVAESKEHKGYMEASPDVKDVFGKIEGVTIEKVTASDIAKIKERCFRRGKNPNEPGHGIQGIEFQSNQADKKKPDVGRKLLGMTVKKFHEGDRPNSAAFDEMPLVPIDNVDHLASSKYVSDHGVVSEESENPEEITRLWLGGVSQEGPKAFANPKTIFRYPEAFITDENGNEMVRPEVFLDMIKYGNKFASLLVSNLARVNLAIPDEKPVVDTKAISEPKTGLEYMEAFYNALSAVGIDPFKSVNEIMAQFNPDQIEKLNASLHKMGVASVENTEDMGQMREMFNSPNKYKLYLALRNADIGIDPFKTEQEMMSTFDFKDEDKLENFGTAINKFLQVQAIEPEDKEAVFTTDLRNAFKKSNVDLYKSKEFNENYFKWAAPEHVKTGGKDKEHGFVRYDGTVPDSVYESIADKALAYANKPSSGGSGRSPLNQWAQWYGCEIGGGFGLVAGKMLTADEMRVELCTEAAEMFTRANYNRKKIEVNITETSTDGLGENPKETAGNLYTDTAMDYGQFIQYCQTRSIELINQARQAKHMTVAYMASVSQNRHTTFGTTWASLVREKEAIKNQAKSFSADTYERHRSRMGF
ncbi:MAG TPA: hypothetical protein VLJ15_08560 [Gammaproteobacteria bacterium]|nr:hypothetical protein [Gammaproteobacteria bacterium]